MITRQKWLDVLMKLGTEMKKKPTLYGWKSPVNEANTLKKSTCVGYVSLALQRAGLLPAGKYIHLSGGKLAGTGLSYIKAHPEIFEIKWVRATPQKLGNSLQAGDICLYTVPHIQVFSGRNSSGTPLWYSLERSSGGVGKPAKLTLNAIFSFYSKRKIECIIRLKFDDSATKPNPSTNVSGAVKTIKYKLKMGMNIRKTASASSAKVGYAPQGAAITQTAKSGSWVKTTYCGITGWINCSNTYATKL